MNFKQIVIYTVGVIVTINITAVALKSGAEKIEKILKERSDKKVEA